MTTNLPGFAAEPSPYPYDTALLAQDPMSLVLVYPSGKAFLAPDAAVVWVDDIQGIAIDPHSSEHQTVLIPDPRAFVFRGGCDVVYNPRQGHRHFSPAIQAWLDTHPEWNVKEAERILRNIREDN